MKRPNIPAIDELEAVLRDIEDMEGAVQELKRRVLELPAKIAAQVKNDDERVYLVVS